QVIDDLAPAPLLERGVPRQGATCAMARRAEGFRLASRQADEDVRTRAHAAADEYRLAGGAKRFRQAGMTRSERARCALAVNEQLLRLAVDAVEFDLARVVGDVEQQVERSVRKEAPDDPACVMAENFPIGERAIDRRTHGAEIALADLGADRRACEFPIGEGGSGRFRRGRHLLQILAPDLMSETALRAADGAPHVAL